MPWFDRTVPRSKDLKPLQSIDGSGLESSHLRHLFFVTIGLAVAIFVAILPLSEGALALLLGPIALSVILSTLQLSAMWAVLGPGPTWQRYLLSFAACCVVGGSAVISLALLGLFHGAPFFRGDDVQRQFISIAGWCSIHWLVAQIPFWVLRVGFRFRFAGHPDYSPPGVTIADMFVLTAIAAASLSAMLQLGDPPGIDVMAAVILCAVLPLGCFCLLTFPALTLLGRSNFEAEVGCLYYFGICAAWLTLVIILLASFAYVSGEVFLFFASLIFSSGLFIGWSIQLSKDAGVRIYPLKNQVH